MAYSIPQLDAARLSKAVDRLSIATLHRLTPDLLLHHPSRVLSCFYIPTFRPQSLVIPTAIWQYIACGWDSPSGACRKPQSHGGAGVLQHRSSRRARRRYQIDAHTSPRHCKRVISAPVDDTVARPRRFATAKTDYTRSSKQLQIAERRTRGGICRRKYPRTDMLELLHAGLYLHLGPGGSCYLQTRILYRFGGQYTVAAHVGRATLLDLNRDIGVRHEGMSHSPHS